MTSCNTPSRDAFFCPTVDQKFDELVSLLPRGRAWGTGAGQAFGPVRTGFWMAVASAFQSVEARLCALLDEFFCSTAVETLDLWKADYGLPDACDPYADLCAKVANLGGSDCAYFEAVALAAGWIVTCQSDLGDCGGRMDDIVMDCAFVGGQITPCEITITVDMTNSPAVAAFGGQTAFADNFYADDILGCAASFDPLACILARIVPAHVQVNLVAA